MAIRKYDNYRKQTARLKGYDYGYAGTYYITICTKDRECFFGEVGDGKMIYSTLGEIANEKWLATTEMRKYVSLGKYVIMPNHMHGIIHIHSSLVNDEVAGVKFMKDYSSEHVKFNKFGPQSQNLASIIRGYKSSVSIEIKNRGLDYFGWQPKFYDRIVRDEEELKKIEEYIENNPKNWIADENNPSIWGKKQAS